MSLWEKIKDWRMRQIRDEIIDHFVQAVRMARQGQVKVSQSHGQHCLELFRKIPTQTLNDCAWSVMQREEVLIPELMHEAVVVNRLGLMGVNL